MQGETLDAISPILPSDCFSFTFPLQSIEKGSDSLKKKHLLPDLSDWLDEDPFASVYLGWHRSGIKGLFNVRTEFEEAQFPQFRKGDSIELFIDTRDLKTAQVVTKFCHHFVFLPSFEGTAQGIEVTSFRGEDRHDLATSDQINVSVKFGKRGYEVNIFLPSEILEGYDPSLFNRIGLSVRINRKKGRPQHFVTSSAYWHIESQPSLWSSMELK